jgi:hypothetical protein
MGEVKTEIGEPVQVVVSFAPRKLCIQSFSWEGRSYTVSSINLFHIAKDGDGKLYHFAVTAQDNSYELIFNPFTLDWHLGGIVQV